MKQAAKKMGVYFAYNEINNNRTQEAAQVCYVNWVYKDIEGPGHGI
jgi:hypothetical protein